MPSLKYHIKRSSELGLDEEVAEQLHSWLDHGFGRHHRDYRKLTHDPLAAMTWGFIIGGRRGAIAAMQHISDDMMVSMLSEGVEATKGE